MIYISFIIVLFITLFHFYRFKCLRFISKDVWAWSLMKDWRDLFGKY